MDIVIVSWNVRSALVECLESIRKYGALENVVVVDNSSNDGTAAFVRAQYHEVRLVANTSNLGFARACNQGAALGTQQVLFFLNPDTQIQKDTLAQIETFFVEQPYVGIVGPKIINSDGSVQPSVRRFPTPFVFFWELFKLERLLPRLGMLRRYQMQEFSYTTLRLVDQVMGAGFAVRRSLFAGCNGFDERFFIWFEEVDFCYRAATCGWLTFFLPDTQIIHQGAASFRQRSALWRFYNFGRSGLLYLWLRGLRIRTLIVAVCFVVALPIVAIASLLGSVKQHYVS